MTYDDFQNLQSFVLTRFSNGKKPTQQDWIMFANIYTAALETHLAENIANNAVDAANLVTGKIVTNAALKALFNNIYASSQHIETIVDMLDHNGFADGAVPTEVEFAALINNFYTASNNKVRVAISSNCLNVQSNASIGIDFKAYEQTLEIANVNTVGGNLYMQNNVYATSFIDIAPNIPILWSPYIGIQLFGCTFTASTRYLKVFEQNSGALLAQLPIQRTGSTYVYGEFNEMFELPFDDGNMFNIIISAN